MHRLLLAAGILGALAAPAFADPAITVAPSQMRRAANPYSAVVQGVPANAQIDIQSCAGDWCYGSWRNLYGFLPAFAVAQGAPPPVVFAAPPPPVVVTAPVIIGGGWGWGGGWGGPGWRHW